MMNKLIFNASIRIALSLFITSILTFCNTEAMQSQIELQRELIANARAGASVNNDPQAVITEPKSSDPATNDTSTGINMPLLNTSQPASTSQPLSDPSTWFSNTTPPETGVSSTNNVTNQTNSMPTEPINTVQNSPQIVAPTITVTPPVVTTPTVTPVVTAPTITAPVINAASIQQPAVNATPIITTPIVNTPSVQPVVIEQPIISTAPVITEPIITAPTIEVNPVVSTAQVTTTPQVQVPQQSVNAPAQVTIQAVNPAPVETSVQTSQRDPKDLKTRIQEQYAAMQNAQNQTFDTATYARFGASLVDTFNDAVEIHSFVMQLLNAATTTPLLNTDQQNYVRNTMLPNLDQIDEVTKPIAEAAKAKSSAGSRKNNDRKTTASGKKKIKKKNKGKKNAKHGANRNATKNTTGAVTVTPINPTEAGVAPVMAKKKKKKKKKSKKQAPIEGTTVTAVPVDSKGTINTNQSDTAVTIVPAVAVVTP